MSGYDGLLTVSELVKIAGISKRTVQYYDKIGLLPAKKRTEAGYRLFQVDSIACLEKIAYYKSMGYELKEIKKILYTPGYDLATSLRKRREELIADQEETGEKLKRVEKALKDILDNDAT